MFNKIFSKKSKKKVEPDLGRRNFLKAASIIPAGVVVAAASNAVGAKNTSAPKSNYLKKEWVEDGINYREYELPENIQPFFKHPEGRGRAISVPIYNLDKENGLDGKGATREAYIRRMVDYIGIHKRDNPETWANPYCYIINIKGNDTLFGVMVNQSLLEFESSVYTVYG